MCKGPLAGMAHLGFYELEVRQTLVLAEAEWRSF